MCGAACHSEGGANENVERLRKKVIVLGGSAWAPRESVYELLDSLHVTMLITRDDLEAGRLAREWADAERVPSLEESGLADRHGWIYSDKAALWSSMKFSKPDLVVAFAGGYNEATLIGCAILAGVDFYMGEAPQDETATTQS